MFILLFLLTFACVFFLSRSVSRSISRLLIFLTRNEKVTMYCLSFLFLPGVIVHELAHWLMASILFVRTGEIEFLPVIHGSHVKLGSVAIAKTDIFRRFLIGIAPIIFGLLVIFSVYTIFFRQLTFSFSWKELALFYMLFEIGNTMYSSGKDMEGAIGFFIITGICAALFTFIYFFFHVHVPTSIIQAVLSTQVQQTFEKIDILLGCIVIIDFVIAKGIDLFVK